MCARVWGQGKKGFLMGKAGRGELIATDVSRKTKTKNCVANSSPKTCHPKFMRRSKYHEACFLLLIILPSSEICDTLPLSWIHCFQLTVPLVHDHSMMLPPSETCDTCLFLSLILCHVILCFFLCRKCLRRRKYHGIIMDQWKSREENNELIRATLGAWG